MRTYTCTSGLQYGEIVEGMAKMLEPYPWDLYATLSTHYPLKQAVARRKAIKMHDNLSQLYPGVILFFASEPFDSKSGCHIHSLIGFPNQQDIEQISKKNIVKTEWQKVTGGGPNKKHNWTNIEVYDKRQGARYYISKYTMRHNTDWEILGAWNPS